MKSKKKLNTYFDLSLLGNDNFLCSLEQIKKILNRLSSNNYARYS